MKSENRHQFVSVDGKYIYHIAVIDYLQYFNWSKYGENKLKTKWGYSHNAKLISAVPPQDYCERFYNFMKTEVIIDQLAQHDHVVDDRDERD